MSQKQLKDKHKEFTSQLDTLYALSKVDGDVTILIKSLCENNEELYKPAPKKQKLNNSENKNDVEESGLDDIKICSIKASSVILRSASPVFYGMLSCEMIEKQQKQITIVANSEKDVDDLLYFMCTNSLRDNANPYNIIHLAHYYQMERLFNACLLRIKDNICIDKFVATVKIFDCFEIDTDYEKLVEYGAKNIKQFKKLDGFNKLSHAFKHSIKIHRINDDSNFCFGGKKLILVFNQPPPHQDKTFGVTMKKKTNFKVVAHSVATKFELFGKTMVEFSYEGKTISGNDTAETLVGNGFSSNDHIDVIYT